MSLVGVAEIAELLGVSKQVVANWRARKPHFPPPEVELKSGPVWSLESVRQWALAEGFELPDVETSKAAESETEKPRRAVVTAMMNMKGGVGKSTLAANLGWYTAFQQDLRVLMIDLDPQFNLSQYLLGVKGYEKLIADSAPTVQSIFESFPDSVKLITRHRDWSDAGSLHLVPASLELAWAMRYIADKAHLLHDFIEEVRDQYDLIILDCSPTESVLTTAAYMATDYIFVPVRPEFLATIGLPLLLKSLDEFGQTHKSLPKPEVGGIVFNDISDKAEHDRSREFVEEFAHKNDIPVFENWISHSDSYPAGARAGRPIFFTDNARSWKIGEFSHVAREFLAKIGLGNAKE